MADPLRFPPPPLAGPARRSALGALGGRLTELPRGLGLEEVPFPGQLWLQAWKRDGALLGAVAAILGVAPPLQDGEVARGEDVEILALADGWLVVTPGGREEVLLRRLRQALEARPAAVTDLTDARAVFHLFGPLSTELLAKSGVAADDGAEEAGTWCRRARFGGIDVLLQKINDHANRSGGPRQPCYRVYIPASLACSFLTLIMDGGAEY